MKTTSQPIDPTPFVRTKHACRLTYRTELGKVVTTQGIIREVFIQQHPPATVAILENGLPISIQNILHIERM